MILKDFHSSKKYWGLIKAFLGTSILRSCCRAFVCVCVLFVCSNTRMHISASLKLWIVYGQALCDKNSFPWGEGVCLHSLPGGRDWIEGTQVFITNCRIHFYNCCKGCNQCFESNREVSDVSPAVKVTLEELTKWPSYCASFKLGKQTYCSGIHMVSVSNGYFSRSKA